MALALAVRARGVRKFYREVIALDGVDLEVPAGRIHGLAGPNGAGKTTLLGLLLGLAVADEGTLDVLGTRTGRRPVVPAGVAGFVDGPGLYPALTAHQNLRAVARLSAGIARPDDEVDRALQDVGLTDVAHDRVRGFSLGMRQRLGVAAALLGQPRLLVLDEPSNGLDPAGRQHLQRALRQLAARGVAVVVSSHRMDDLTALCSSVSILDRGHVVFDGSLASLAAESGTLDYRVRTTDPATALKVARTTRGLQVVEGPDALDDGVLVVRGPGSALDELVTGLSDARVGLRELAPVLSALESAYLALTDTTGSDRPRRRPVPDEMPADQPDQVPAARAPVVPASISVSSDR